MPIGSEIFEHNINTDRTEASIAIYADNGRGCSFQLGGQGIPINCDLTHIKLRLKKYNDASYSGDATCYLMPSAGASINDAISTGTISADSIDYDAEDWYDIPMSSVTLTAGTTYFFVLLYTIGDASHRITMYEDSSDGYVYGAAKFTNDAGSSLSSGGQTILFAICGENAEDYTYQYTSGPITYNVKVLTTNVEADTWTVPTGVSEIDIAVIAPGGASGYKYTNASYDAGGGGAGGLIYISGATSIGGVTIESGATFSFAVGTPVNKFSADPYRGKTGADTVFGDLTAKGGGGGGGTYPGDTTDDDGADGGSGGGGGCYTASSSGGSEIQSAVGGDSSTYGHGYDGANGVPSTYDGGGGGGAGSAGSGNNGGDGYDLSAVFGAAVYTTSVLCHGGNTAVSAGYDYTHRGCGGCVKGDATANRYTPTSGIILIRWEMDEPEAHEKTVTDSLTITENVVISLGINLAPADSLSITEDVSRIMDFNLLPSDDLEITDELTGVEDEPIVGAAVLCVVSTDEVILLEKPYWYGADGRLLFNNTNINFRSGSYAAYIEDISDEEISLVGAITEDAETIIASLNEIANDSEEIAIYGLNSEWMGFYVISNFSYKPIGLDVFEYKLTLKYVEAFPDDELARFQYKKTITVDHTKVSGDLENFPVLVYMTDADLKHNTEGGELYSLYGYDIRFYSTDGLKKYDHELVSYDKDTGEVEIWVKIPELSSTEDTLFDMYYGNINILTDQSTTAVWDENYLTVHHLKDYTTSTVLDSTANDFDGTKKGANEPIETTGIIATAAQTFDGDDDYISLGDNGDIDADTDFTIEAWVNVATSTVTESQTIVAKGNIDNNPGYGYDMRIYASKFTIFIRSDTTSKSKAFSAALNSTGPFHVVAYFDRTLGLIGGYVNGVWGGVTVASGLGTLENAYDLTIGAYSANKTVYNYYDNIDEVRVSNTVRSEEWIETEYANQSSPSSFYSVGAETEVD